MITFIGRRALQAIPTLFILISLCFFMVRLAPGGPFDGERVMSPQIKANILKAYHLDQPVYKQYIFYWKNLLHGDLGPSYKYRDWTVNQLVDKGFPVSLRLGTYAMLFSVLFGVLLGAIAAVRQDSWVDYTIRGFSGFGLSIPNFVVGPVMVLIFAVTLNWLPAGGWGTNFSHLFLPVLALALPQVAIIARMMRGSLIEVLHSNFIRTAYAKGLSTPTIIFRHALRPTIMPVISYLGPNIAAVITGSMVVEQIFGLPGIGTLLVQAATNRDYTTVLGITIIVGTLIVSLNFLVDILYAVLDPRIRY